MREDGGFMRVYWSGAWYFLAADARLRLQSGGKLSLDQALERLNQCCAEDRLSVPEMVARLDEVNRVELFRSLYDEVAASTTVPPFADIFASLGIDIIDGQVRLQENGPGARVRRAIAAAAGPTL
jgi:predicted metalloprotease with PDZ domain